MLKKMASMLGIQTSVVEPEYEIECGDLCEPGNPYAWWETHCHTYCRLVGCGC